MKKQEFMTALKNALAHAPSHIREEIMADISEHFTEAISQGMTEEEVCHNLGDPRAIAGQVMEEYGEPQGGGERHGEHRYGHHHAHNDGFEAFAENMGNMFSGFRRMFGGGEGQEINIDESFNGIHSVRVKLTDARLRFAPSEDGRFRVTVRGHSHKEVFVYENDGVLVVGDKKIVRGLFTFIPSSKLVATVYVPAQFDGEIKASTASGNISAVNISGQIDMNAAAGNISLEHCRGRYFKVNTAAGNATVELADCPVEKLAVNTAAGNATVKAEQTAQLELSSAAGNVTAEIRRITGDTKISTAAGSAKLTAHYVQGDINVSTAVGTVTVRLPRDTDIRIKAQKTGFGSIEQEIPGNPASPYTLRASSSMGSVKLRAL